MGAISGWSHSFGGHASPFSLEAAVLCREGSIHKHIVPLISKLPPLQQRHVELQQQTDRVGSFEGEGPNTTFESGHRRQLRADSSALVSADCSDGFIEHSIGLSTTEDWDFDDETAANQAEDALVQPSSLEPGGSDGDGDLPMLEGSRRSSCQDDSASFGDLNAKYTDEELLPFAGRPRSNSEPSDKPQEEDCTCERFGSIDVALMETAVAIEHAMLMMGDPIEDESRSSTLADLQREELDGGLGDEPSEVCRNLTLRGVAEAQDDLNTLEQQATFLAASMCRTQRGQSPDPSLVTSLETISEMAQQLREQNEQLQQHNGLLREELSLATLTLTTTQSESLGSLAEHFHSCHDTYPHPAFGIETGDS